MDKEVETRLKAIESRLDLLKTNLFLESLTLLMNLN